MLKVSVKKKWKILEGRIHVSALASVLSGLSILSCTKRLPVGFPARVHAQLGD